MSIQVLLADDQDIIRAGLTAILNSQPGIEVTAQAADGREAVALARRLHPDECLFDMRMPHMDEVEATGQPAEAGASEPMAVVAITTSDTDQYVYCALQAGARGSIAKDAGPQLLAQAIRAAAEGDALIAPRITARLPADFAGQGPAAKRIQPVVSPTDHEEEVAATAARGRTNAEIAVKFHLAGPMNKIGVRNRVQIVIWVHENRRLRPTLPNRGTR